MLNRSIDKLRVVYYTHPFCRESWAMHTVWRDFVGKFGNLLSMGICITQSPVPGETTHSAQQVCLAVKAASLQSVQAADFYLEALRAASIESGVDLCKLDNLVQIARQVSKQHPGIFDMHRFGADFNSSFARKALYDDQKRTSINGISHSPTITMTLAGRGVKITGPATGDQLSAIVKKLVFS